MSFIGYGDDKPRMTGQTHCSVPIILARDARCGYCGKPGPGWDAAELVRGKRGMRPGLGVEYHCMNAFYSAS